MKRFVASMLAIAIAVCFSLSMGCGPGTTKDKDKDKDKATKDKDKGSGTADKFSGDKAEGSLDKKDADFVVTFTHGKVKSVAPSDDTNVSATVKDDKVTFKQLVESPAKEAKVDFTVTGGKDEKETFKVAVTVKAKAAPSTK